MNAPTHSELMEANLALAKGCIRLSRYYFKQGNRSTAFWYIERAAQHRKAYERFHAVIATIKAEEAVS